MDPAAAAVGGLAIDLYMGTSSSQLFLYSSTTFGTILQGEGKWVGASVQANANASGAPNIPSGSVFVQVQVRDANKAAPGIFTGNNAGFTAYGSLAAPFSFTLGTSFSYPVMWGAAGNWPVGSLNMDTSSYGPGARGAIGVNIAPIPEPTSFALAGLGAAAMLIFRRRK
jgi:hypothetical protein